MSSKNTILVPVDFSDNSRAALEYAAVFARHGQAELLIVHAPGSEIERLPGVEPDEALEALLETLHEVKPSDSGVPCRHRLLDGLPAKAILAAAEDEQVQMIVMGTHGRTGLRRLLMGSVAEEVVRHAACPVLVLRESTRPRKATS